MERELAEALQAMLDLHEAHHNHPTHANARALLRQHRGVQPDPRAAAMVTEAAECFEARGDYDVEAYRAGIIKGAGHQPDTDAAALVAAAAEAHETFGDHELERWATEHAKESKP